MATDVAMNDLSVEDGSGTVQTTEEGNIHQTDRNSNRVEFSLPKADGGKDAWLFLGACFCVEALVWGLPFSFGIFQEYYTTHEPFSLEPSGIAAVGTTATGIMYMIGVILFPIYQKWPRLRSHSAYIGLPVVALSLIAASFANKVWHLILTQGVIYGLGGSLVYYPTFLFLDEWFIRRKGFAFGVMWAGTGASGLLVPIILTSSLSNFTFRTILRAWGLTVLLLALPLTPFLRPRLPLPPNTSTSTRSPRIDLSFLRTSTFWLLQTGNILQGLGFFLPGLYLPSYASTLGVGPSGTTALLSLLNTCSVLSAVVVGLLMDRLPVTHVVLGLTSATALGVLVFWGLASGLPLLCVFAATYGLFAGGFSSTYTGVIKEVKRRAEGADAGIVIGLLSAGRGIGAVVSGPLSEVLLGQARSGLSGGGVMWGYGSAYEGLILFTGLTAAAGGVSFLGRVFGWM